MTAIRSPFSPCRAFTLIEVLIAVSAFAIVLIAVNTVFYSALRLHQRATDSFDQAVPLQHALAVIKRDLLNMTAATGTLSGELLSGTSTSAFLQTAPIQFQTTTGALHDYAPWGEVQQVGYILLPATNNAPGRDLYRVVRRNLLAPTQEEPAYERLAGGFTDLTFSFYDGYTWRNVWDSEQEGALPSAVRFSLHPANTNRNAWSQPPVDLVVPILATRASTPAEDDSSGGAP